MDEPLDLDPLLPDAPWFWAALEIYCVSACCGLDAFEFSHQAVRRACGDDVGTIEGAIVGARVDPAEDPRLLADRMLASAARVRATPSTPSTQAASSRLNAVGTTDLFADLLDDLAAKLVQPWQP